MIYEMEFCLEFKTKYNENSIAEWWNNTCKDCGFVWIVNK